jgi:flagellar basal-body rod modification protein FlgD
MKIEATTPSTTATPPTGGFTGSKDEFLRLFMAQLQHQDPLSPKSGSDMVAQLAQFSSVEQAQQTNQLLKDLTAAQDATSNASLSNLVGRDCNAAAADFQLDQAGAVPPLQITSTRAMTGAVAVITDDAGNEVRRIPLPSGVASTLLAWDGKDKAGVPTVPGSYHITVEPGTTVGAITSQWHGRIDAVELTPDGARLRMGGLLLIPAAVRTIGLTSTPTPATQEPRT